MSFLVSWTLLPEEMELLGNKTGGNRIGFALLLKFFELEARFPNHPTEIPETVIPYIAKQVKVSPEKYTDYDWQGRTIKYHRAQIRNFLGFKEADSTDVSQVVDWLCREVVATEQRSDPLKEIVYQRFRELHLEPPTPGQIERLIRSSLHKQETQFCAEALSKLPIHRYRFSVKEMAGLKCLPSSLLLNQQTSNNSKQRLIKPSR